MLGHIIEGIYEVMETFVDVILVLVMFELITFPFFYYVLLIVLTSFIRTFHKTYFGEEKNL